MKKLILVLVLLAVPFQVTWAAVGAYCQHETGVSSKHFGHHSHQHRATIGDESKGSPGVKLHPDCGFCSIGSVGVANSSFATPSPHPTVALYPTDPGFLASVFLELFEPPKWAGRSA